MIKSTAAPSCKVASENYQVIRTPAFFAFLKHEAAASLPVKPVLHALAYLAYSAHLSGKRGLTVRPLSLEHHPYGSRGDAHLFCLFAPPQGTKHNEKYRWWIEVFYLKHTATAFL